MRDDEEEHGKTCAMLPISWRSILRQRCSAVLLQDNPTIRMVQVYFQLLNYKGSVCSFINYNAKLIDGRATSNPGHSFLGNKNDPKVRVIQVVPVGS